MQAACTRFVESCLYPEVTPVDDPTCLTCQVDLADSCALHFVHRVSIWRPLCVKVKSDRTHHVVLLHVSQFHPQSTISAWYRSLVIAESR